MGKDEGSFSRPEITAAVEWGSNLSLSSSVGSKQHSQPIAVGRIACVEFGTPLQMRPKVKVGRRK